MVDLKNIVNQLTAHLHQSINQLINQSILTGLRIPLWHITGYSYLYLSPNIFHKSVLMVELGDLEVYPVAEKSFPCFLMILNLQNTQQKV